MKGKAPPLAEIVGDWLDAHAPGRATETIDMYEMHMLTHVVPRFGRLERMTTAGCADYIRQRIGEVSASTLRKELSSVRLFLAWCHEVGVLPEPVVVPRLPKRALGTPVTDRAQRRVELTREQVEAMIARIPERSRKGYPARAFVLVAVETGLRRATLWRLEAPRHYHVGARGLTVTRDIDKARDGRTIPISDRARAALDAVCPEDGPIFGRQDIRTLLRRASMGIDLPDHLAGRVSYHDLRHFFLTDLAASGASLGGMQYLAGHRHASTTSRYIHPAMAAAEEALAARDARRNGTPSGTPAKVLPFRQKRGRRG